MKRSLFICIAAIVLTANVCNAEGVYTSKEITILDTLKSLSTNPLLTTSETVNPIPDVMVNGRDGPVIILDGNSINATLSLAAADLEGAVADWWLLVGFSLADEDLSGILSYVIPTGWVSGISMGFQGPLIDLPSIPFLNLPLPPGWYVFALAVDTSPDGALNEPLFYDLVEVEVRKEVKESGMIGPSGGSLVTPDGDLTLTVPDGALTEEREITIERVKKANLPDSLQGEDEKGFAFNLLPEGLTFNKPVTIRLRLSQEEAEELLQDGSISSQVILTEEGGELTYLDNIQAGIDQDTGDYFIEGETSHFSHVTRSTGLLELKVFPAYIVGRVDETIPVYIVFSGREDFTWGNYGSVEQVYINSLKVKTVVPEFVNIDPQEHTFIGNIPPGDKYVSFAFSVVCKSIGSGVIDFYLEKPHELTLFTKDGLYFPQTINKQYGIGVPVICVGTSERDSESGTDFFIYGDPYFPYKTGYVGASVVFTSGAYFKEKPFGTVKMTATVDNPAVAGPSPQIVEPYPYKHYYNRQDVSFECLSAGVTSITFLLEATFLNPDGTKRNVSLTVNSVLKCIEEPPIMTMAPTIRPDKVFAGENVNVTVPVSDDARKVTIEICTEGGTKIVYTSSPKEPEVDNKARFQINTSSLPRGVY